MEESTRRDAVQDWVQERQMCFENETKYSLRTNQEIPLYDFFRATVVNRKF